MFSERMHVLQNELFRRYFSKKLQFPIAFRLTIISGKIISLDVSDFWFLLSYIHRRMPQEK